MGWAVGSPPVKRPDLRAIATPLALALLLAPRVARSEQPADDAPTAPLPGPASTGGSAPLGLVLLLDAGGGGMLGGDTQYARSGVFELEFGAGWDLPGGFRPEVSFAWGLAPRGNVAVRAGLHYQVLETPFYVRGALDWSNMNPTSAWRWLLLGGGGELRLTDLFGVFAELDGGIPLARNVGFAILVRGGVTFRF